MIERLMLRASDAAVNGGDPLAALNPELIIGPIVRALVHSTATKDDTLNDTLNFIANPLQLLGLVLNIWLYGMQLMQVEVYFRSNPRYVSHIFYSLLQRYRPDYQASDSYTSASFTYPGDLCRLNPRSADLCCARPLWLDPQTLMFPCGWRTRKTQ